MTDHGLPVLFALFIWWFSTGLILYLDSLPGRTFRWSMAGATAGLAIGMHGLVLTATYDTVGGAYAAFVCGLLVWAWHEMAFLMGIVTGPRKIPCAPGTTGWARFVQATATIIWHELAILATALAMLVITWNQPNHIGTSTFLILWGMRLSAKLNVFLGVPNLTEEFLPEHLGYLKSYIARKPMNLLFPLAVTAATVVTVLLIQEAAAAEAGSFAATGFTLLAALMALAVLEHWFLVLPLPDAALWSWLLPSAKPEPDERPASPNNPPATNTIAWGQP